MCLPGGLYRLLGLRQLFSKLSNIRPHSLLIHPKLIPNGHNGLCALDRTEWCLLPVTNRPALNGVQLDDLVKERKESGNDWQYGPDQVADPRSGGGARV